MGKTTLREKIGYSFASLGDASAFGLVGVFLMFFLTTVAGISPGIAGTIAAIGSIWNAAVNPVIGYFADRVHTRFGKRRPVIFAFSIPLLASMALLFTNVELPDAIKPVYYGFFVMLYWTSYTGFFVPYLALGADYTTDYDDRTVLRLFSSFFNMVGSMFSMVMPTLIVEFLERMGMDLDRAWSMTGLMLGILAFVSIIVTVIASKKKDPPCRAPLQSEQGAVCRKHTEGLEEAAPTQERLPFRRELANMFHVYLSVARLKPMGPLIAASLLSLIGYTFLMSDMVYLFTYNMGLSAGAISGCLLARTLLATAFIPIVGKLIFMSDRRGTLIGCYVFGSIGLCLIRFADFSQGIQLPLYLFFATTCTSIYWQIMPGIFYDICEYDRIENGQARSATILSFQGLLEAAAMGIGGQLLGLILEMAGFDGDAAVQSDTALVWIENAGTVLPVIFLLAAAAALYKYPLNRKAYNALMEKDRIRAEDAPSVREDAER